MTQHVTAVANIVREVQMGTWNQQWLAGGREEWGGVRRD